MSSVLRSHRQIGAREKFLITLASTTLFIPITQKVNGTSVIDADKLTAQDMSSGTVTVNANNLLRDMGREVNIYADGVRAAVLREVQIVNGTDSEGVPASPNVPYTYLVPVWVDTNPSNPESRFRSFAVTVARVG
jgi:hypothetical protein